MKRTYGTHKNTQFLQLGNRTNLNHKLSLTQLFMEFNLHAHLNHWGIKSCLHKRLAAAAKFHFVIMMMMTMMLWYNKKPTQLVLVVGLVCKYVKSVCLNWIVSTKRLMERGNMSVFLSFFSLSYLANIYMMRMIKSK